MAKNETWPAGEGVTVTRILGGRSGSFLVSNGSRRLLVDTGTPQDRRRLASALDDLGVERIDWLVLTHTHYDHAGNARFVRERFGARVAVHRAEAEYLASGLTDGEGVVPRGTNSPLRFATDRLEGFLTRALSFEPCAADLIVDGPLDFSGDGIDARIILTPGHSIGSISVIADGSVDVGGADGAVTADSVARDAPITGPVALAGDAVFGAFPGSAFPPFAWDAGRLIASWTLLLETSCRVFIPAHGKPVAKALLERELKKRRPTVGVGEDSHG
jgi:glyoxylase-like metal-dependent hydrolase (beta-lactamase superfamily II)